VVAVVDVVVDVDVVEEAEDVEVDVVVVDDCGRVLSSPVDTSTATAMTATTVDMIAVQIQVREFMTRNSPASMSHA
jgi:hypothetical protein